MSRKPDHQMLVDRLQKQVDEIQEKHNGRPPTPKLYRLRDTMKRWDKERAEYREKIATTQAELDAKPWPMDRGYRGGSIRYYQNQIREIDEKAEILATLDLRTAEEIRGTKRKEYERDDLTEQKIDGGFGHLTNEQYYERYHKPMLNYVKRQARERAAAEAAALVKGSKERREYYLRERAWVWGDPDKYQLCRKASAAKAIAEKRGEEYVFSEREQTAVDHVAAVFAKLEALDEEYADVIDDADLDDFNPAKGVFTRSEVSIKESTYDGTIEETLHKHDASILQ